MSRPTDLVPGEYLDAFRVRRTVSPGARTAVIDAMGLDEAAGAMPDPVAIVPRGAPLPEPGELLLEDGTGVGVQTHSALARAFGERLADINRLVPQLALVLG